MVERHAGNGVDGWKGVGNRRQDQAETLGGHRKIASEGA